MSSMRAGGLFTKSLTSTPHKIKINLRTGKFSFNLTNCCSLLIAILRAQSFSSILNGIACILSSDSIQVILYHLILKIFGIT